MENNADILKEKAYNLHIQGKFDEAKVLYELILKDNPDNISVKFLYAQLLFSLKDYIKAIEYFKELYSYLKTDDIKMNIAMSYYELKEYDTALKEIEQIKNINEDILKLKAKIYVSLSDIDNAISVYEKLAEYNDSEKETAFLNISILNKNKNNLITAFEYALKAYNINNSNLKIIMNAAQICELANDIEKLIFFLQEAEKLSNNENILLKIAFILEAQYDFQGALLYYLKVLNFNENSYIALIKIASMYLKVKNADKALNYIEKAAKLKPNEYNTLFEYYKYYFLKEDYEKALEYAFNLISIDNNNIIGYESVYEVYHSINDYISALNICNQALKIKPDDNTFICRKGVCLSLLNRDKEALDLLENHKNKESYTYKKIITSIRLLNKDYEAGMQYYNELISPETTEQMRTEENNSIYTCEEKFYKYYLKKWYREDITEKKILVHQGAHGAGDYIMFTRYIPELEKRNCKVIVEASENFYDLFKMNFKKSTIIKETKQAYTNCDYTASAMDLFYSFNYNFDRILYPEGWLDIPIDIINQSHITKMFDKNKKNIGIFYQGNKKIMSNRHIKKEEIIPLLDIENANFYSLDIANQDDVTIDFYNKHNIINAGKYIKNAVDTSIFLKNIDVLITVDSFPVHLAGALGVKTFLLLPADTEWRWFKDEKRTPWYNSVKIFRQKNEPGWGNVIKRVQDELLKIN